MNLPNNSLKYRLPEKYHLNRSIHVRIMFCFGQVLCDSFIFNLFYIFLEFLRIDTALRAPGPGKFFIRVFAPHEGQFRVTLYYATTSFSYINIPQEEGNRFH